MNVHEAKTHFSKLLQRVAGGESVTISRAGKPIAKLVPLDQPEHAKPCRTGFLAGQIEVPEDFDRMSEDDIAAMFSSSSGDVGPESKIR